MELIADFLLTLERLEVPFTITERSSDDDLSCSIGRYNLDLAETDGVLYITGDTLFYVLYYTQQARTAASYLARATVFDAALLQAGGTSCAVDTDTTEIEISRFTLHGAEVSFFGGYTRVTHDGDRVKVILAVTNEDIRTADIVATALLFAEEVRVTQDLERVGLKGAKVWTEHDQTMLQVPADLALPLLGVQRLKALAEEPETLYEALGVTTSLV